MRPSTIRDNKLRLDLALVQRGLAETRARAQALILAGHVRVDGQTATKAGQLIPADAQIVIAAPLPYVSRGGIKLAAALDAFAIRPIGWVCADVGASTGGFTDCLLQYGAARVYAIDVGYGELAWSLRNDARVVVLERTNARYLSALPDGALVDLATIDVSFISLRLILPAVRGWLRASGHIIALIKPQFEAGRAHVGRGGVVRDRNVHRAVLVDLLAFARELDLGPQGVIPSPVRGPAGNIEFLAHLQQGATPRPDLDAAIERSLDEAPA
jgi:23S rRNA (cytidine1920-2'-O)/16S rRNA (cytidine1409-2'-O)-methyltransferase